MKSTRRIKSVFSEAETKFKNKYTPKIPSVIHTTHLTLLTILWSILVLICYGMVRNNSFWLLGASLMILLQYLTDLFDGAVGRYRKTGLIRWGYYMDHLLDYVFMCAVLIGYSLLLPYEDKILFFFILALFGAFMTHVFLSFSLTRVFKISYFSIGPTEIRVGFILINILLLVFGQSLLIYFAPIIIGITFIVLIGVIYRMQKKLWKLDMAEKRAQQKK